ncbi:thioredoxin domain-containing protein [Mycolicibacterium sp. 018/SC-01/001]|uniref:thioredoxin domain-containing protein n=1 Tax=Mycolicibacterium sp. 018/SC-01/001 TaxID=2592069 RepID=UPI00117D48AB|nr:thioredoxin domain-containing protein [Mycolicibacterium sp. 018/SC-01/001]TRW78387.1 thioredoxin domain-containing protein [Mycolicibacterium sp. 018/SC-01/001]
MSPTQGRNTLGAALSPYLRQHADNPVHWQQWGAEALAAAADRDVPVLLSIGYAACHWCHVMAHESFADPEVAAIANAGFVCIKVDREERPDLDAIYMSATMALTGQGGWPMTCFLTPDGRPFFCGTYYPKATFLQLLSAVSETWRLRRSEVEDASARIAGELQTMAAALPGGAPVTAALCDSAVDSVLADEDTVHGGFGDAPKFPPSALLEALLRHHERTGADPALAAAARTGEAMARGGVYDQLAGGFARYSVDAAWVVPHFEKMLYDNAQLLRFYAHWARLSGDPLPRRVTRETARFLLDDLRRDGMFVSSLDADAAGREGSTYVWTPAQLRDALGDDAEWAAAVFGVTDAGSFEHGASVLQLRADPTDWQRFDAVRATLRASRGRRPQPERDDKVVTAWNGLAITALCEAGVALADPELIDAAAACARALLDVHVCDGRLRRTSLGGETGPSAAILDDHAALATGLLTLHQMTGEPAWLDAATGLLDVALQHFTDPAEPGRWYDIADDAEHLLLRPADPFDGATPSGASSIAEALMLATHLAPSDRAAPYARAAEATLASGAAVIERAPRSAGHWLAIAEAAVRGPIQIAVSCVDPQRSDLLTAARVLAPGGAIVVGGHADTSELLRDRPRVDGADAAYVCRGRVCDLPVRTAEELAAALRPSV